MELGSTTDCIRRLYQRHGTQAFALLEGNFSLVLWDPGSQSVFLVVDKYGCDDIFVREEQNGLRFASHPAWLLDDTVKFDSRSVAFFLAQEGFVPAPFTLFDGIKTVGRARFLRIQRDTHEFRIPSVRYWRPSRAWQIPSTNNAVAELFPLLESAVDVRATSQAGLLLSGGMDSALLANILARRHTGKKVALTGAVSGYADGEEEIVKARKLAQFLEIDHEEIILDPFDEALPDEWSLCTESSASGTRVTLPLFLRFGRHLAERLGVGYSVLSGQMADTLADNNYTLPSMGYALRRLFYSPGFHRVLPLLKKLTPSERSRVGKLLIRAVTATRGLRTGGMVESLLDGLASEYRFYEGRVFGYGEMPGRSKAYFPALTAEGFDCSADWYSATFVEPVVAEMQSETFYRDMIELSMDMVMLPLDTRLVFHAFRLARGNAEMPFLDSRVVNFFVSLPDSARAVYRAPKHIIRQQFKRMNLPPVADEGRRGTRKSKLGTKSMEQLLLSGSLGVLFRELLATPTAIARVPGLFDYVDESYLSRQIELFMDGRGAADCKFISRMAALELWSRVQTTKSPDTYARATA
ncbi:MAG: asparagine synthase-related protein [Candidatus Acidiferrales bacterium]